MSIVNDSNMKLGRKAIKTDSRTLAIQNYLTPVLPLPPPSADWTKGINDWGMKLNDVLGDCTIAAVTHAIEVWSANTGTIISVPDEVVKNYYELWDGYVQGDSNTDNGGVELDVLKLWKKQGFAGNMLMAFADARPSNLVSIRQSIHLFGGVYIGLSMPLTARTQDIWDLAGTNFDAQNNSWGGHCVFVPQYDEKGFTCITWGKLKTMTIDFWNQYCDEAHVLLGQNWLTVKGAPNGFNEAQLQADLKAIR